MKDSTKSGQPIIQQGQGIDIAAVLETRNINFDKAFTLEYCQEVIEVLNKVQAYDSLVGQEKYIRFTLNTPGGSIFALFGLIEKIEALKELGYTIHTHVAGMAASCGFILYISGNYRTISQFGYLLNHQGSSMTHGTVRDMEVSLDLTKKLDKQLNEYIKQNTELSDDEIDRPYRTNTDVWYTSQEALDLQLASKIVNY